MSTDTLTITDNRTGKSYELPISDGTIKASDLRKLKLNANDYGLMSYDLALFGELPTSAQLAAWQQEIITHTMVHENIKELVDAFRHDAHPMGMFISAVASLSSFYPESAQINDAEIRD